MILIVFHVLFLIPTVHLVRKAIISINPIKITILFAFVVAVIAVLVEIKIIVHRVINVVFSYKIDARLALLAVFTV